MCMPRGRDDSPERREQRRWFLKPTSTSIRGVSTQADEPQWPREHTDLCLELRSRNKGLRAWVGCAPLSNQLHQLVQDHLGRLVRIPAVPGAGLNREDPLVADFLGNGDYVRQ